MYKSLFFLLSVLLLAFNAYCNKLNINVIGYYNGVGLSKDIDLLLQELTKLGHDAKFVHISDLKPLEPVDVNIFNDVYEPYFFAFATKNYFLPNPEQYSHSKEMLQCFDKILCKTKEAERIYSLVHPHVEYLSFSCKDCYDPLVSKNYKLPLHLIGASTQKGDAAVARVWIDNPQFPSLSLIRHKGNSFYPPATNLQLTYGYLPDAEIKEIQNRHGLHLCPSETEGFGHYIIEAMSCGSVIVTTDAPPMNEFILDPRCLAKYKQTQATNFATSYFVDEKSLEKSVANLLTLQESELEEIGRKNREWYLQNDLFFKRRLGEIFQRERVLQGEEKNLWGKTHFLWNLGLASRADLGPDRDPIKFFRHYYRTADHRDFAHVKKGDVLWMRCTQVPDFARKILPTIKEPFILLISDGDESFPSGCKDLDVDAFIAQDKIMHIFAQNCDYKGSSKKISHLPIGIDFHSIAYRGGWFGESSASPEAQEAQLKEILAELKPTYLRKRRAYVDFQLADSMRDGNCKRYLEFNEDRTTIFNRLVKTNLIDYGSQMKRSALWRTKGLYAFSISPHGNGLDCHRTWEDLVLGCIVIVKTSPLDPLYEGLPVVIVKDWDEVTDENMQKWLEQYKDAFTNLSFRMKLTNDYWMNKIKTAAFIAPFDSSLNYIIPPEIKNDVLYHALQEIARKEEVKTILEIGSSAGEGSTEAFVKGIRRNPHPVALFCMEVSKTRFAALKQHYQDSPFVKCYNVSSIPLSLFPKAHEVAKFYNTTPTQLNSAPFEMVLDWLRCDLEYIEKENVPQNGIEIIRTENGIDHFDVVLIDGSEFTGKAEFDQIYGARYIILDDTNTYKNFANRQRLLHDPHYELVEENLHLRNGYAIFKLKG